VASVIGRMEVQQTRAYLSPGADLTLSEMDNHGVEFGLASGSALFFSDGFGPGQAMYINTPNGGVAVAGATGFRVDIYPDQQSTVITNFANGAPIQITGGGGFVTVIDPNQSIQLTGTNPVYAQPLLPAPADTFDRRANVYEGQHHSALAAQYVNTAMIGYEELDNAGQWQPASDYGPIWFPRVQAGWAPYHNGHWVNRPFFGWTWVADEPWGAAPFHYGRWVVLGGRWGWIPGPRNVPPVWSPAQVVFAGGVQVGGVGVSVWFPLGPGEAYKPWYPCSPQYIDRVNITNIQESRVVHVQTTYVNIVNVTNVTNVTYVNRTVGVTAMRQEDFAAGHSAASVAVKVDPRQIEHVQVSAPAARPPAQPVVVHPVAKPAAVQAQRPMLVNHQGQQVAAVAHPKPAPLPVKPAPPAPKPIPGRTTAGAPTLGNKPAPPAPAAKPAPPAIAAKPETPAKSAQPATAAKPQAPAGKAAPTTPAPAKPAAQNPPVRTAPPAAKPEAQNPPVKQPPVKQPPVKAAPPAPAAKPEAAPTNHPQPAAPGQAKPAGKDQKKDNKKHEEKKTPPEKPE
jgi:ribosomal protein S11